MLPHIALYVLIPYYVTHTRRSTMLSTYLCMAIQIWGLVCQRQVSRAGTSNYIPQILWDVITCPCPWYLLLTHKSILWGVVIYPCPWHLLLTHKSILWGVVIYPCPWYLLLTYKSMLWDVIRCPCPYPLLAHKSSRIAQSSIMWYCGEETWGIHFST